MLKAAREGFNGLLKLHMELASSSELTRTISLQREPTVIVLATSYNGSILLTSDKVEAEDGERNGRQNDAQGTVVDAERQAGTVAVQSIVNLQHSS